MNVWAPCFFLSDMQYWIYRPFPLFSYSPVIRFGQHLLKRITPVFFLLFFFFFTPLRKKLSFFPCLGCRFEEAGSCCWTPIPLFFSRDAGKIPLFSFLLPSGYYWSCFFSFFLFFLSEHVGSMRSPPAAYETISVQ